VHSASSITHKHGEAGVAIGLQDSGRGGIRAAPGLHLILARASDGLDWCETTNQTVSTSNLLSSRQSWRAMTSLPADLRTSSAPKTDWLAGSSTPRATAPSLAEWASPLRSPVIFSKERSSLTSSCALGRVPISQSVPFLTIKRD
jgi:hypothetical protein